MTRDRLIEKLRKIMRQRDGEAALGNTEAAEAFAAALNRMMLQHEITAVEAEVGEDGEPEEVRVVEAELERYGIRASSRRSGWQERLASVVADAHLCEVLVAPGCNRIWFVGAESHAAAAEYSFGTLAAAASRLSLRDYDAYWNFLLLQEGSTRRARGFRASWLFAFIVRIQERLRESREAAMRDGAEAGVNRETALVRIDSAEERVRAFLEIARLGKTGGLSLPISSRSNTEGRRRGRATADSIQLGQRGVGSGRAPRAALPSGEAG